MDPVGQVGTTDPRLDARCGPGQPALSEWAELGLALPDLDALRRYRLERVREQLRARDYAGIVCYDPMNLRYAVDSSNMSVWTTHNAVRYCFIATDGPVVVFDFHGCEHLSDHLALVDEVRPAQASYYFGAGARFHEIAGRWAGEIAALVRAHGAGNPRLAVDHCSPAELDALRDHGIDVGNGEEVMQLARAIKGDDELAAMRCAVAACDAAIEVMRGHLRPGITEQRLWSYLHAENIARGGEWIETRLLASGPRTNPWFHECGSRVIEHGDLVAFDTDLVGPYAVCVDLSRTWLCGDGAPTGEQRRLHEIAHEQILHNTGLLRPGVSFAELGERAMVLPDDCAPNRYSVLYHGVGMCDEYPAIYYPQERNAFGYDGVIAENMVLSVESYVGRVGGREGVKLEEQVLVTATGAEPLSAAPYDDRLMS